MKDIDHLGKRLSCRYKRHWPPRSAYEDVPYVELAGMLTDADMSRHQTWIKNCGLMKMDGEKCSRCALVLVDGKPACPPGIGGVVPPFMNRTGR